MTTLSHLDAAGRPRMVDVGDKPVTARRAVAEGAIVMSEAAVAAVRQESGPKGTVLVTAELAGTMAAKHTGELIPLCHPLPLEQVTVQATLDETLPGVRVRAEARITGKTGVEMEALTAVSVALLTVYDMLKAVDRSMKIEQIVLREKSGGTSGTWIRGD
ncbi:MAG TPA: cyclic pyranopterin monophosphate synthase MoaC [Gemmatimonadales bacterium]|nr:cyclic pyranopterin monophosphate synthase MoaC [Gemmatimonadales bacterium]